MTQTDRLLALAEVLDQALLPVEDQEVVARLVVVDQNSMEAYSTRMIQTRLKMTKRILVHYYLNCQYCPRLVAVEVVHLMMRSIFLPVEALQSHSVNPNVQEDGAFLEVRAMPH